ncbi:MAG: protein kinase, partial [Labilithrix sp.]|nr:protein kinase [Labilithrix sp.]
MSDCLDDNGALELLDGRLPSAARAQVERHIESCDACRELLAELAKADADESGGAADTERTPIADSSGLTHAGPYRIERPIGSGAAGTVYRAVDDRTKQVVALKYVTDLAWRARFGREVETLSRLAHPGIVRYIGHGETPHGLYLAMEWLDGEDLERRLRRGPLPWQAVRILGLRLTAALAHAHALGAVHRDLGPRNVFLPGGRVEDAKLLDFGLVRVRDGLERTASQAVLGTPFYMAPEQVKDPKNVDARADLFALGVLFYETVSGVRPFQGEDLFTVWVRIVDHAAPDLRTLTRGVPEAFILVVEALLAKDPQARPASAADVHRGLVLLEGLARSAGV